ncbi:MAG: NAD+ synthase [Bacteroidales bacterium]|nr:NAD+ synthase [Bacteroidales bacterium]MCF8389315.1 NAD+ synthase [Bacteroidales bacterium]
MKIALAQIDYHIGNFLENTTNIVLQIKRAQMEGADLIVFSELSVCGYPPLDLLERKDFIEKCNNEIHKIARICKDTAAIIGAPTINPNAKGKLLFNSAYFLYEGEVKAVIHKTLLPTYDIFDEYRYFEPNSEFHVVEFKGKKIALTICEDLWDDQPVESEFARRRLYMLNPMDELIKQHPDFIVNIAASPYSHMRSKIKKSIFIEKAKKYNLPVIYVNQVGAQTQLIFEGGSMAIDKTGGIIEQLKYFSNDFKIVNLDKLVKEKTTAVFEEPDRIKMVHDALITGIKGYFKKMGFYKAVVGLSGGIDSAVTVVLAVRALGAENVHALLMPSQYSSDHSISDSIDLANNLQMKFDIIDIQKSFDTQKEALSQIFNGQKEDITEENLQSRIRAVLLMAFSNKFGHILLNTSNKSEAAVGYGTLYGDMSGGLSVLGDVYKTDVYELAKFINRKTEILPVNIIEKPPSAELKPNQKDSDSLPEYEILDKILFEFIEKQKSPDEIIGFDSDLVTDIIRKVNMNEYKRFQTPPILRISSKAFGGGRRIPLVAKY